MKTATPRSWRGPVLSNRAARLLYAAIGVLLVCPLFWDVFFGKTYVTVTAPRHSGIELKINQSAMRIPAGEIRTYPLSRWGTDTVRVRNVTSGREHHYVLKEKPNNSRFILPTDHEQCFAKIRVREMFELDKGPQPLRPRVVERHPANEPLLFYLNDPWPRPKVVQYVPDPWMIPRPYDPITQLDFIFAVPCTQMNDDRTILQSVMGQSA